MIAGISLPSCSRLPSLLAVIVNLLPSTGNFTKVQLLVCRRPELHGNTPALADRVLDNPEEQAATANRRGEPCR